jgi:hypothetical protein
MPSLGVEKFLAHICTMSAILPNLPPSKRKVDGGKQPLGGGKSERDRVVCGHARACSHTCGLTQKITAVK